MAELQKNQIVTARMTGYTAEGAGVCRVDGRAVFVPGAMDGELWEVRIVRPTASAAWGRGERLLESSPRRAEPDCDVYPRCGGCALRHMDYEEELSLKLRRVNDALQRIGGLDLTVGEILPAAAEDLRRKVIFNVGEQNGRPVLGFYRARSHEIVPAERCPAVPEAAMAAGKTMLEWMKRRGIPAWDEAGGRDGVRHVFFRSSHLTEESVVTLIVSRVPDRADLAALRDMLRLRLPGMRDW